MTDSTVAGRVHSDWENREFIESIQMNVLHIVQFLNRFDNATRYRLARVNERLSALERALEHVEGSLKKANNR